MRLMGGADAGEADFECHESGISGACYSEKRPITPLGPRLVKRLGPRVVYQFLNKYGIKRQRKDYPPLNRVHSPRLDIIAALTAVSAETTGGISKTVVICLFVASSSGGKPHA